MKNKGSITGNDITSAQEITCHPPNVLESFAPSAYPIPHRMIAKSMRISPTGEAEIPWEKA